MYLGVDIAGFINIATGTAALVVELLDKLDNTVSSGIKRGPCNRSFWWVGALDDLVGAQNHPCGRRRQSCNKVILLTAG